MNKEQQDLAWACLPKEARDTIRQNHAAARQTKLHYYCTALEDTFGVHNLTSDTEPEEMLIVERKKVQKLYYDFKTEKDRMHNQHENRMSLSGRVAMLQELFGDKCLPDKEQPKPKFDIGQKVLCKVHETDIESVCTISSYNPKAKEYKLLCGGATIAYRKEDSLKPYIEREYKFNKGDKIIVTHGKYKTTTGVIKEYSEDDDTWAIILNGVDYPINFAEEWIEPYTEEKETMEEKELDIYELLQNCSDVKTIYSVAHDAEVEFNLANRYIEFMGLSFYSNGSMYDVAGRCMLYPSRALYEKYPLDAYSAWMEWKDSKKSKTPKTWNELIEQNKQCELSVEIKTEVNYKTNKKVDASVAISPIEKSALALLKIHQLIKVGYGGNVSKDEFFDERIMKYIINLEKEEGRFRIYQGINMMNTHIAFHTKEQAEEFLSYPKNVQLLRDYFQIN